MRTLEISPTFEDWQAQARNALSASLKPDEIIWEEADNSQPSLEFLPQNNGPSHNSDLENRLPQRIMRVPKQFMEKARAAALHSSPGKWSLLYRILWRLTHFEPRILENPIDADTIQLAQLEKQVSKDAHRMIAHVRFREIRVNDQSWFVAWYEPEHDVLERNSKFFIDRYTNMRWSILTPKRCMHWNQSTLSFTEGVSVEMAPREDAIEPLWLTYYANIFNPARVKVKAMQAQLPKRSWKNLPEALVIEPLLKMAPHRVDRMFKSSASKHVNENDYGIAVVPEHNSLDQLRSFAAHCHACPLWKNASCTVFGEGPANAEVVLVGEQPGDQEDRSGRPFIGPAGQLLNRALLEANLNRSEIYTTNAVKHFKWEPQGKRRLHQTPNARDIAACRPWIEAELQWIKPKLIVCLGATAIQSVLGAPRKVTENRGAVLKRFDGRDVLTTVHPSSILRLPTQAEKNKAFQMFVADLQKVQMVLEH